MELQIDKVGWSVEGQPILNDIESEVDSGEFVGLIGPNGSGKSSLLRCIYRSIRPDAGIITLDGEDIWNKLKPRELAQKSATVLQESASDFDFTVHEIAMMGRNPHKGIFENDSDKDFELVAEALQHVGLSGFSDRNFLTLSGGEKQRVLIARALAQQAKILILDEPTNHLDIYYQLEVLDLVKSIGITTLAALHDLNLAALYCDRIYILKNGCVVASGTPEDVLSPELIYQVYGVKAEMGVHPELGTLNITFIPNSGKRRGKTRSILEEKN